MRLTAPRTVRLRACAGRHEVDRLAILLSRWINDRGKRARSGFICRFGEALAKI